MKNAAHRDAWGVTARPARATGGFALLFTLTLLGFLVLLLLALAAVTRVEAQAGETTLAIEQARRNALYALALACGQLQQAAGPDQRTTAQAGILGAPGHPRWTGVWGGPGASPVWLVSGGQTPLTASADAVILVGGATATEPVSAPRVPLRVAGFPGIGGEAVVGGFAYWVGDEGVKLSLAAGDVRAAAPTSAGWPAPLASQFGKTFDLSSQDTSRVLTRGQLAAGTVGVDTAALKRRFHEVTVDARAVLADPVAGRLKENLSTAALSGSADNPYLSGGEERFDAGFCAEAPRTSTPDRLASPRLRPVRGGVLPNPAAADLTRHILLSGVFNLNSTSADAWRAVLEIARVKNIPGEPVPPAITSADLGRLADGIVAGLKARGAPFRSITELRASGLLPALIATLAVNKVPKGQPPLEPPRLYTQDDLLAMLAPLLVTRSDTFCVRAYGDVQNPATGKIGGRAWCEAIVQREPRPVAVDDDSVAPRQPFGRRFHIVYFRWLAADDV